MIRASSVILTPAQKKLAVTTAKESAKNAKAVHAKLVKDRATLDKDHAAKLKELDKAHKAATAEVVKAYGTSVKDSDKAIKLAASDVTKTDSALLKLTPTVAVPNTSAVPTETM